MGHDPGARAATRRVARPSWVERALSDEQPRLARALAALRWPTAAPEAVGREPYGRRLLHASDAGELVLVAWAAGAESAAHDHAGGHGRVFVLCGSVRERAWTDEAALRAGAPPRLRTYAAGESLEVTPTLVHAMADVAPAGSVTLHVYENLQRAMRVPDPARRSTWLLPNGHGAWLPADPGAFEEQAWPRD